ncbi:hypothetical protein CPLU01_11428 [Colletotrichum plurivorum]|uniref:Uncharacterized protein n=1 Tax=Colletotrichum plurivorum TaxID=2175906 RepID=A0A8H6K2D3_9PEZI|nr:hypothetical protein CPLU01_11428 [Colletotrichum plurivorum]
MSAHPCAGARKSRRFAEMARDLDGRQALTDRKLSGNDGDSMGLSVSASLFSTRASRAAAESITRVSPHREHDRVVRRRDWLEARVVVVVVGPPLGPVGSPAVDFPWTRAVREGNGEKWGGEDGQGVSQPRSLLILRARGVFVKGSPKLPHVHSSLYHTIESLVENGGQHNDSAGLTGPCWAESAGLFLATSREEPERDPESSGLPKATQGSLELLDSSRRGGMEVMEGIRTLHGFSCRHSLLRKKVQLV